MNKDITVETTVNLPVSKVWEYYTLPHHIINWNNASEDWCTRSATNDLRIGGKFNFRMEAKDGSAGFDFWGIYTKVDRERHIAYEMGDGRNASVDFSGDLASTRVVVNFEMEETNSEELQRKGWQAILDNFKRYAENQN